MTSEEKYLEKGEIEHWRVERNGNWPVLEVKEGIQC